MKQLKENGLEKKQVSFDKNVILEIIQKYTKEAGIRELERCLAKICRKIVLENIIENKQTKEKIVVNSKKVREFLGVDKYQFGKKNQKKFDRGSYWIGLDCLRRRFIRHRSILHERKSQSCV